MHFPKVLKQQTKLTNISLKSSFMFQSTNLVALRIKLSLICLHILPFWRRREGTNFACRVYDLMMKYLWPNLKNMNGHCFTKKLQVTGRIFWWGKKIFEK